jgi:parvulin-like peptidyl-prolyl isomerase
MKLFSLGFLFLLGCDALRAHGDEAARIEAEQPLEATQPPQIGYPEGPWWSEGTSTLIVSASHILVSHRDAKPTQGLLLAAPATRSRDEALQRAWQLYLNLRDHPARFAEVAARDSDEPLGRAFGGALGTLYADVLPRGIVDALGHVREGEVTRPVETEQGFHVLRRLAPAAPISLDLAHIVVRYDGVSGWQRSDREVPERTREEARALAERFAREAKQAPDRFGDLAREHSDAEDALRGGDKGTLSTYEATDADEAQLFAVAAHLPPGGVSDVVELAASGFHVVRRTPPSERPALAASVITVGYIDSPLSLLRANATRSRDEAEQLARRTVTQLAKRPDRFEAMRAEQCDQVMCEGITSWKPGRHLFALEAALEPLRVGEITAEPVATPLGFLIVRREDAQAHPPPSTPPPTFSFPVSFFGGQIPPSGQGS